jgi:hypothetical protein
MQHAIARQAEAERERRAKIINAEGEAQAAAKLSEAADVIGVNPVTIQLRYLQTLREIGGTQNSTIVFPMPVDLMRPMIDALGRGAGAEQRPAESPEDAAPEPAPAQLEEHLQHELGAGTVNGAPEATGDVDMPRIVE